MRWLIRNQILIPLVAIQSVAVTAIAITTATLAARRSERQIIDRLNGVAETVWQANFPYTASETRCMTSPGRSTGCAFN
jgi:hypothetical protein